MAAMAETLKQLGPMKLGAMAAVAVVLIGFFAFLAISGISGGGGRNTSSYSALYPNLDTQDATQVARFLDTNNIPYDIRGNGGQIFVPPTEVDKLRLRLATEGIPSSGAGVGYEIFDKTEALGTSNFVQNVNLVRALEGELARTISAFGQIERARVHLVMPKRELFSRETKPPSASVALKLSGGQQLAKEEIAAIRYLVATAVPGLELERITIVDNNGRLLARGGENDSGASMASDAYDYRVKYETQMRNRLEELLEETLGPGNVKVNVSADIDFDRIVRKSETFDPEGQVARSVQSTSENENAQESNSNTSVSVANNLPDPNAGKAGAMNVTNKETTDETTNFEISKTVEDHVRETGTVKKLSVAVLVNGVYSTNAETEEVIYTPREQQVLDQIGTLVRSAIGYDEKRGDKLEVVNMQFNQQAQDIFTENPLDWLKSDFHNILQTGILGVVAILAILLVIRPLVNRAIETTLEREEEEDLEALMAPPEVAGQLTDQSKGEGAAAEEEEEDMLIDMQNVKGRVKSSSVRRISEILDKHPEESLSIIRTWMTSEPQSN